jgi:uncharacterized protein
MAESSAPGASQRLEVVDVLRGFALMALFLVHMVESYELYWANPQPGPIVDTVFLLFMGKSFSLLALCFGFSFFVLMDRAAQRGSDFSLRFAWRLLILQGIGVLHALVYRGDIIQLLSGLGLLLLLAHRIRSNRMLVALAVLCFLAPTLWIQLIAGASGAAWANAEPGFATDPAMQVYLHGSWAETFAMNLWAGQLPKWAFMFESGRLVQIMGLFLLGMVLGRIGFFVRPEMFRRARWIGLGCAAALALFLHFTRQPWFDWFAAQGHGSGANRAFAFLLGGWFELMGTFTWALVLVALWQGPARALLRPLTRAGRATLTLYILQSVVFVPAFYHYGLGLWDDWGQGTRLIAGLLAIAFQLALAALWFRHFQYGPIEWVWRALTYLRTDIPFRRRTTQEGPER